MAVRANHETFIDTVLEGHGELGANLRMAGVAEINLLHCQQILRNGRLVDGMAIGADYVAQRVRRAANIGSAQSFRVAPQTVVQYGLRLKLGEGNDGSLAAARLDVGLTRTVAAFAPCSFGWLLARSNAPVVGILIKGGPDVRVAGPANVAAYKGGG